MLDEKSTKKEIKSIINEVNLNEVLEINISSSHPTGEISKSNVLWADAEGEKILYKLFNAIKDDLGWITTLRNLPNYTFERTSKVLYRDKYIVSMDTMDFIFYKIRSLDYNL